MDVADAKWDGETLIVGEFKYTKPEIDQKRQLQSGFFAGCCGLAQENISWLTQHSGLYDVFDARAATLIRVAAYTPKPYDMKNPYANDYRDNYNSGYVICSTDPLQVSQQQALLDSGFIQLARFMNPAHGSNREITIWGAPTIPWGAKPERLMMFGLVPPVANG